MIDRIEEDDLFKELDDTVHVNNEIFRCKINELVAAVNMLMAAMTKIEAILRTHNLEAKE